MPMAHKTVVLVQGAESLDQVPGLSAIACEAELRLVPADADISADLHGAEVVLGWDFSADTLAGAWPSADALRWIHWSGAGVDAVLFDELVRSEVVLTNSRGVFDRAIAEYVLLLVLSFAKRMPQTTRFQSESRWNYRLTERVDARDVLVVGTGSIGSEIARLLTAIGMRVSGVGRRRRDDHPVFGTVHAAHELDDRLPAADFVVAATPLTSATRRMFSTDQFALMKRTARFINVGRGAVVDEAALVRALRAGEIAGAALDVFESEPLRPSSPLWTMDDVIVSPHMSGDFLEHPNAVVEIFLDNFRRYRMGEPLRNVVDKELGYVPS
jgi:phosphoglycerate dehydrogenase-like enzyme